MYFAEATLDDLLRRVIKKLLASPTRVKPTRGTTAELTGVLLQLNNPRARLSRTETRCLLFGCVGELLWYLAKSNDVRFIGYYLERYKCESDDGRTVFGAYGPRLFNMNGHNQIVNIVSLLKRNPPTRRAVIQLFSASDLSKSHKDVPCTCTLQFLVRDGRLCMLTSMRSNDAFRGLPHDVFAFTMLQEIIARSLHLKLGSYKHAVGSLHLYDRDQDSARRYLKEGWQSTTPMPAMPDVDPWISIQKVLSAERVIRRGRPTSKPLRLPPYWADIVRLLRIFRHIKKGGSAEIARIKKQMSTRAYDPHIDQRTQTALKRAKSINGRSASRAS
jgi:thymidylate synthase